MDRLTAEQAKQKEINKLEDRAKEMTQNEA